MPKRRIQKQRDGNQTIYIDSCFVDAYLWGDKDANKHAKKVFRKIKKTISSNPNIKVVIPFVAVGETVNTMIQKGKKDKNDKMFELIEDLKADTPPPSKTVIEIAFDILKKDKWFDPSDAIIATHALCDEYSTYLLTTDTNMQTSKVLSELEEGLEINQERKHKLKITEVL